MKGQEKFAGKGREIGRWDEVGPGMEIGGQTRKGLKMEGVRKGCDVKGRTVVRVDIGMAGKGRT